MTANASDSQPQSPGLVLGTAGHIDHGKTSLVKALTGRDLDRLPEEKARGITIELGFTPLDLGDGMRVALVDVPGHEKFVRTMVAGASGIDLLLLVVAADEGVMPQTREHLAICELLGIERGLVVLTKADLVDEEMLELAAEDVRDALAGGALSELEILPASATTGDGIERIREALKESIAAMPSRTTDERPPRLPIDRTFTKHGFGSVVTGTWSGRSIGVGDGVILEPGRRKAKVRGLEQHGAAVERAEAGSRIAVNLGGIAHHEIHRGDLLTLPDSLHPTHVFDAQVSWLATKSGLSDSTSVELLVGTCERRARLAPIGSAPIGPGEKGFARIHVDGDPVALLPGDRFVLRGFARDAGVGSTLGGGLVLDVAPPHRRRRDAGLVDDLARLAAVQTSTDAEAHADGLLLRIERAGLAGVQASDLARETGLPGPTIAAALRRLTESKSIFTVEGGACLAQHAAERLMAKMIDVLEKFHAAEPLQPGMPRATLTGSIPSNTGAGAGPALLAEMARRGEVTIESDIVARAGFASKLGEDESALAALLRQRYVDAALDAPTIRTLVEELGEDEKQVRALAHYLEREGVLVAAPDDLFFDRSAVRRLIQAVTQHFETQSELDTQTLKSMIGTSRRTAVPLMALLDDLQITRRDGSVRRKIGELSADW